MGKYLTNYFSMVFLLVLSSCSNSFYYPSHNKFYEPKDLGYTYKDLWFKSNGNSLNAWHFKSAQKKTQGTILFFHGNAQNISAHFLNLSWLTHYGYELILFDYQGYGRSQGKLDRKEIHQNGIDALNFAHKIHQNNKSEHFIVFCQSLGGAICSSSLSYWPKAGEVDFLILDSTFSNYKKMASSFLQSHWLTYLFSPLAYLLVNNKLSPHLTADKLKMKTLVMHSKADKVVPYNQGQEFFTILNNEKEFWSFENEKHINAFSKKENQTKFVNILESLRTN